MKILLLLLFGVAAVVEFIRPTEGAADRLANTVTLVFFALMFFAVLNDNYKYDSTDNGKKRSGLKIYTDHLTGVQYVSNGSLGGLVVRVNEDGLPMTVEKEKRLEVNR